MMFTFPHSNQNLCPAVEIYCSSCNVMSLLELAPTKNLLFTTYSYFLSATRRRVTQSSTRLTSNRMASHARGETAIGK